MGVAAVGALFLKASMWLCILALNTLQALWVATMFVAAFGLMIAFVLHDNIAVHSATAAYAAVLVVFVALVAERGGRQSAQVSHLSAWSDTKIVAPRSLRISVNMIIVLMPVI